MPICSNPKVRRVRIPVGESAVVLLLRDYSAEEYTRFMSSRFGFSGKGKIEDQSMEARLRFIDALLMGLHAEDPRGNRDVVTYIDAASGEEKTLTPEVDRWKEHINPSWKISAALELEGKAAEVEYHNAKN